MNTSMVKLYKKSANGSVHVWMIYVRNFDIIIEYGQLNGLMQVQVEAVPKGLASRTRREQVLSRVKSRISKQRDKGYKTTIDEALENHGTNALGLVSPMLAQPLKRVKNIDFSSAFVQPKYDGHRCLITMTESGEVLAYSRLGNPITSISHITDVLRPTLKPGMTLDGELYCHGEKLQVISSWVKRRQPETSNLSFIFYDLVSDKPYADRLSELMSIDLAINGNLASFVSDTYLLSNDDEIDYYMDTFRRNGYEGAIVRHGSAGYQPGIRSHSLVKIKSDEDGEYTVIDILRSKDGWAVLVCDLGNGQTFKVSAPGSIDEKIHVLVNPDTYIGQSVTVRYAGLTIDGKPFHCVAERFRTDI